MKLVPAGDIRTALGFEDMPDINDAISTSLDMTTEILARYLDTRFGIESNVDVFYVPPYYKPERDGFTHTVLRLSKGFVAGTPLVEAGGTSDLTDTVVITTMQAGGDEGREKGILKDYETSYVGGEFRRLLVAAGPYIKVTYGSGFLIDPSDPTLYHQDQVPSWLKELARMQTLMLLSTNPIVTQAGVEPPNEAIRKTFGAILDRHQRFYPSALIPLFSKEVR